MMHDKFKWYDACSNVVQISPTSSNSQNWLEHRGIGTKIPKFWKKKT